MASSSVENPQSEEVAKVKEAFPGRCRVIKDVGVFTHVVTLQPQDMDVTLKFQLEEPYPSTVPQVSVRSESLTQDSNQELITALTTHASELLGQPMLIKLVTTAEKWLKQHGIKPGRTVNASPDVYLTGTPKKPKKPKNRKKKPEDEEEEGKKPSMKTSDDVVKRILWDDKLDKDDFLVGYLDRFKGLVEKYFSAFSWEDLASVDYDVLAVPKHRIQYFKYRSQKIWDKPSRMDNVFGSTGSGLTIYDVINNYQEPENTAAGNALQSQATNTNSNGASNTPHGEDKDSGEYDDSSDDDDDDDDGITVTIGTSVNTDAPSKQEEQMADDDDVTDGVSKAKRYDPFWQDKMRPNYFLAVRITDPDIRQGVEQVQDYLLDHEPSYQTCCIPPAALHVTVFTLGLDTPETIAHAKDVLQRLQPEIANAVPKTPLKLEGVANFYNRVLYAKVEFNPEFVDFVNHLKLLAIEAGLEIRDQHEFVPHMTIMKVTRPVSRLRGTKNIDPWLYSGFERMAFGEQKVDSLYLCSMGNERRADGFYLSPAEIHF